jgi:hypothetical protein
LIDEVVHLPACPNYGLADNCWIEEGGSGDVFWAARNGDCGGKEQRGRREEVSATTRGRAGNCDVRGREGSDRHGILQMSGIGAFENPKRFWDS